MNNNIKNINDINIKSKNKKCIFTVIIGDYDYLPKLLVNKNKNWDYICFSDNNKLKSEIWNIIHVTHNAKTLHEKARLSRYYKLNYYKYLDNYDFLFYTDARISIINNLDNYLCKLENYDYLFNIHPDANSILEEFDRVLHGKLEKIETIKQIKERYEKYNYNYDNGLFVGKFLLFQNNERVIKFFKDWWYEVKNYSYRDQLSLNFALSNNKMLKYKTTKYSDTLNNFFKIGKRKQKRLTFNL